MATFLETMHQIQSLLQKLSSRDLMPNILKSVWKEKYFLYLLCAKHFTLNVSFNFYTNPK